MIDVIKSMSKLQKQAVLDVAILAALAFFVVGYAASALVKSERVLEESYRAKANFCHDRMKKKEVLTWWRENYCKGPILDAIDPITGRPVAGIVEGE